MCLWRLGQVRHSCKACKLWYQHFDPQDEGLHACVRCIRLHGYHSQPKKVSSKDSMPVIERLTFCQTAPSWTSSCFMRHSTRQAHQAHSEAAEKSWDCLCHVQAKIHGPSISISQDSALVMEGANIQVKSLELDGALVLQTSRKAKLVVDGLKLHNCGWKWQALKPDKPMSEEQYIRHAAIALSPGFICQ